MNYIKELNAFREFLLVNRLPASAIALWYALISVCNKTGWKQRFNVPGSVLGQLAGLSKQGVVNAQNYLIEHGLISCEKGHRGKAAVYEMVSLADDAYIPCRSIETNAYNVETNPDPRSGLYVDNNLDSSLDKALDISTDQSLTIPKQKHNKRRREEGKKTHALMMIYEVTIGNLHYLQLIIPASKQERRDLDIGDMTRELKAFAMEIDIPIVR